MNFEELPHTRFVSAMRTIITDDRWAAWQDDLRIARTFLSRLYGALLQASDPLLLTRFEETPEDDLFEWAQAVGEKLNTGSTAHWESVASEEQLFDCAVSVLRFLDEVMSDIPTYLSQDNVEDFRTEDGSWVLPCRKFPDEAGQMLGRGFKRRGLLYNRIVPCNHRGNSIQLYIHEDLSSTQLSDGGKRSVGAALFPELKLEMVHPPDNALLFLAKGIESGEMHVDVVRAQCAQGYTAKCDTLIWPELTMPPGALEAVKASLEDAPLNIARPPVVVAGSWHVLDDGVYRNRCEVLDGRGAPLFNVDKCLRFMQRSDGQREGISGGTEVPALYADGELIVIFICLDFCHYERDALVGACDASYVFVPSMGGLSTIKAHMTRADEVLSRHGTQTVVVQQIEGVAKAGGAIGYILQGQAKSPSAQPEDLEICCEFTSF